MEQKVVTFKVAKARAEVVSSDVINNEEKIAQQLSNKLKALQESVDNIALTISCMQPSPAVVEEQKIDL